MTKGAVKIQIFKIDLLAKKSKFRIPKYSKKCDPKLIFFKEKKIIKYCSCSNFDIFFYNYRNCFQSGDNHILLESGRN